MRLEGSTRWTGSLPAGGVELRGKRLLLHLSRKGNTKITSGEDYIVDILDSKTNTQSHTHTHAHTFPAGKAEKTYQTLFTISV